jgi:hypothetical protein
MKYLIISLFILYITILSCSDDAIQIIDDEYTESKALILKEDLTETLCSGGWFVKIENDTLRIYNMSSEISTLVKDNQLPLYIIIKWKKMTTGCGKYNPLLIEINEIKLAKL